MRGGFSDSRDFDGNLASTESDYRLRLPDRRGHGRMVERVVKPWATLLLLNSHG